MKITGINPSSSTFKRQFLKKRKEVLSQETILKREEELEKLDVKGEQVQEFANLDSQKYIGVLKLLNHGILPVSVNTILSLKPKEYEKAIISVDMGISPDDLIYMTKLSRKKFKNAEELHRLGLYINYIRLYTSLNNAQLMKSLELTKKGYSANIAAYHSQLNNEQKAILNKLREQGVQDNIAYEIAKLPVKQREKCLNLISDGINILDAYRISALNGLFAKKADMLYKAGIDSSIIADIAIFNSRDRKKALKLYENGENCEYITNIIMAEKGLIYHCEYEELLKKGYGKSTAISIALLSEEEIERLTELTLEYPEIKQLYKDNYVVEVIYKNTEDAEVIFTKEIRTQDGSNITLVKTFDKAGIKTESRTERYKDGTTSSYTKSGNRVIRIKYNSAEQIEECLHIILNEEDKSVQGAIYSKSSDILKGAYESTEYIISEFKQDNSNDEKAMDFDINQIISSGGRTISKVTKNPDGSISYRENIEMNGFTTIREYDEKKDSDENILSSSYTYRIEDESGKLLLDIKRTTKKNADGTAENTINGIKYTLLYDNDKKTITISDGNRTKVLNFKDKLPVISREEVWNILKNQPVDTLLTIEKNVKKINYCSEQDSQFYLDDNTLSTGKKDSVISHESGHIKDYEISYISNNKDLLDLYNTEMLCFLVNFPYNEQKFINYFSPRSELVGSDGFDEFIAESNLLSTTYGEDLTALSSRAQFIVRYFPRTIAMTSHLLGKDSRDSLLD